MTEDNQGWQAPPPPEKPQIVEEVPQMSEPSSLLNIFFEPGRTFEFLSVKPKFILGLLIIMIVTVAYQNLFMQKMGEERFRRFITQQIDKNPRVESLPTEQKQQIIEQQITISRVIGRYAIPVFVAVFTLLLALCYWLGTMALGGSGSFLKSLSVVVYSAFPPTVIGMIANIIILFLKDADEIDIATSQRGLVHANPTLFFEGKEMPVVATLLATLDVFQIWGWILAAIGLTVVAKISKVSAWTVVLFFAFIGIAFRVIGAIMSGNPS